MDYGDLGVQLSKVLSDAIIQALVIILPTIITVAVTRLVNSWAKVKKANAGNVAFFAMENAAKLAVNAAEQLGGSSEEKKEYAYEVVAQALKNSPVKFSEEQIFKVIDASIEAAVYGMTPCNPAKTPTSLPEGSINATAYTGEDDPYGYVFIEDDEEDM